MRLVHYLEYVVNHTSVDPLADEKQADGEQGLREQMRSRLTYYQIAHSISITDEECVRLFKQLHPVVTYRRGGIITICDRQQLSTLEEMRYFSNTNSSLNTVSVSMTSLHSLWCHSFVLSPFALN